MFDDTPEQTQFGEISFERVHLRSYLIAFVCESESYRGNKQKPFSKFGSTHGGSLQGNLVSSGIEHSISRALDQCEQLCRTLRPSIQGSDRRKLPWPFYFN